MKPDEIKSWLEMLNEVLNLPSALLWIVGVVVFLVGVTKLSEIIAAMLESLKKIGFRYSFTNAEQKLVNRLSQQFCLVLRSDLDAIAKAENWNDQWFTDLEAEVEAEGGYYDTALSRLFKRRSHGIRRVPSLVQAIESSTERCMLLVGEPGSGKSIALRHLARILADRGAQRCAAKPRIPLYINLKELPPCDLSALNADFIKQFVLDHVRRGDSDTAEYVREHWQSYKEQGIWLFLFDSFDEIPAVLHAPNNSPVVAVHSQALRQFMDGMGDCRGVLASREYKGPEALPWSKLRIMPLNEQRQEQLIQNTFLSEPLKNLVRQHLAAVESGIFGNPLFMSLLCRYVADIKDIPKNDHDLLNNHIQRLTERDPDYVQRKYGLNGAQLLEGATLLAVLFAELPDLSLAPKFDDIESAFADKGYVFPVELVQLLSALIEIKIGRCDVKEARAGDRRFTFSHRRYQETLFVQYLAKNPEHIPIEQLLLEHRWREFTVTLIQSQPTEVVDRISQAATKLIDNFTPITISVPSELAKGLHYFDWQNEQSRSLLSLLQLLNQGFVRRLDIVPDTLRLAIARQLVPCWNTGDLYDKLMVVRHGGLLPKFEYQKILEWAVATRTDELLAASFENAQFLDHLPEEMSEWLRRHFADEVLLAKNKIALYKLEAYGGYLPKDFGETIIFNRCRKLRALFYRYWLPRLPNTKLSRSEILSLPIMFMATLMMVFWLFVIISQLAEPSTKDVYSSCFWNWNSECLFKGTPLHEQPLQWLISSKSLGYEPSNSLNRLFGIWLVLTTSLVLWLELRATPVRLTLINFVRYLPKEIRLVLSALKLPLLLPVFFFFLLYLLEFGYTSLPLIAMTLVTLAILATYLLFDYLKISMQKVLAQNKHQQNVLAMNVSVWTKIQQANSPKELKAWLKHMDKIWLTDLHATRAILRYAQNRFDTGYLLLNDAAITSDIANIEVHAASKYCLSKVIENDFQKA